MIEILIFGLSENQGGIETYLKKIWNNIDRNQFHFNFIDMTGRDKKPCFHDDLKESGASFFKITPRNESIVRNRKDIQRLFKCNHFDILHFNINSMSYVYPVKVALKNKIPVIIHSRNGGATLRKIAILFHYFNRFQMKYATDCNICRIAVSNLAGEWLFGNSSFSVFNNGVDVNKFVFNNKGRKIIREELMCEHKHVIGNVGAFLPAKNHEFILKVFARLAEIDENAVLWLVGEGPEMDNIKKIVEREELTEKVFFLGKRTDIEFVYAGMDCFLFPSLYEGFPNAVLEAECEGLPCIISDVITKDVIVGGDTTVLSLTQGINEWVSAVKDALEKRNYDREKMAEYIEEQGFSTTEEIERIERLYNSLVENNVRPANKKRSRQDLCAKLFADSGRPEVSRQ